MKVLLFSNGLQPNYEKTFVSIAVAGIVSAGGWVTARAPLLAAGAAKLATLGRCLLGAQLAGVLKKAASARLGWQP